LPLEANLSTRYIQTPELLYTELLYTELLYDELLYDELLYDELLYDELLYDELLYDELLYDELLYDELLYDELLYDELLYDELLYDELLYTVEQDSAPPGRVSDFGLMVWGSKVCGIAGRESRVEGVVCSSLIGCASCIVKSFRSSRSTLSSPLCAPSVYGPTSYVQ
jgi:hypothetical protein